MTDKLSSSKRSEQLSAKKLRDLFFSKPISLSSAPFYASILVIFCLTLFVGIFWMINEYQAYEESIDNIRFNYNTSYRERVKEEYDKVVDFIEYERSQFDKRVEEEIRDKVQTAYTISSHVYQMYKDEYSVDELKSLVAEALRPIRWSNGRGYYFAGTVEGEEVDLFADEPWFEGKGRLDFRAANRTDVIGDIINIIRDKGAGIYHYRLMKPEFPDREYSKTAFVKYFAPFDWFIGAGVYTEEIEKALQDDILAQVQNTHFGKDGEVLAFRGDGTIIASRDMRILGWSLSNLFDDTGYSYGRELLDTGLVSDEGGYVQYSDKAAGGDQSYQRLSYVKSYRDWNWLFATSMSMAEMEQAIAFETQSYRDIAFKNVTIFIVLFVVAVSLMLLISYYYSLKIREGINLFTNFFRQAADSNVKIGDMELAFSEFDDLRNLANQMVADRIQKEKLLGRDELRLDTLLRLGMMEKHSLNEKYNFVLQRVVQITGSQEGYLALVNSTQSHLTICSLAISSPDEDDYDQGRIDESRRIESAGLAGTAVGVARDIINNRYSGGQTTDYIYPYRCRLENHIDIPVFDDGKIVMIAGVCNKGGDYDNSDVRQVKMLVEGMWLHVLKTSAEKEMARLERQIIAVSEEERSNVGRDLHDNLGSHLTGVELLSKVLQQKLEQDDPEKAGQLAIIRDLIRDAIEKTRRLAQGLYPAHVNEHGLENAIEELVNEAENLFRVQCTYSFEGDREWVDNVVATHVYYIIREAVFNAARHGRPDNIGIFMRTDPHNFAVRIVDDGSGFEESSTRKGLGCHTMQYRARAIGAELTISSEINGGTIVSISGEVHT